MQTILMKAAGASGSAQGRCDFMKGLAVVVLCLIVSTLQAAEPEVSIAGRVYVEIAQEAKSAVDDAPALKKKLALTQFDVTNSQHVDDIENIYDGLPSALSNRLEASGDFLSVYDGRTIPPEAGAIPAIKQIAAKTGAQFLISGVVVNASINQGKGLLGATLGGFKKRFIEIELTVYDGVTGDRLMQRRYQEQAEGDLKVGNDKPFASSTFFETNTGQAFNRLLDFAVKDLQSVLKKVPFAAHIVRVQDKTVYLDAGSDSQLKLGDKLVAYVKDNAAPVYSLNGALLGAAEHAADTLTLTQVQPQFAIGELSESAAKNGVKPGNVTRINLTDHRLLTEKQTTARLLIQAEQEAREEARLAKIAKAAKEAADKAAAKQAEIERIQEVKRAKAQAIADAKAAKVRALQEARARRSSAAKEARERVQAQAVARAAARAKAAELKAAQIAEAARLKAEKIAQEKALAIAAAEARAAELKLKLEAQAEAARLKAEENARAEAEARVAAEARAAELKLKQEAQAEASRLKAEENARLQAEAARIKAMEQAAAARLKAEAQAESARLKAEAQAETARLKAEAQTEATRLKAEAQTEATRLKAEAQTEASRLKAEELARAQARAARLKARDEDRSSGPGSDAKVSTEGDELKDDPDFKTEDDEATPITEEQAAEAEAEEEKWLETEYKAAVEVKAAELKDRVKAKKAAARLKPESSESRQPEVKPAPETLPEPKK